mgnify:FL=1
MLNLNINCDILQEKNIVRFNGAALELMRYEGQEIQVNTYIYLEKDGKKYHIPKKSTQSKMAYKSGMNYVGKPIKFKLCDNFGFDIPENELYVPHYRKNCEHCGSKLICNGCCDCGKCD